MAKKKSIKMMNREETIEKIKELNKYNTHTIFSEMCNLIGDARAALDSTLDLFTQWIGIEHNIPPVPPEKDSIPKTRSYFINDVKKFKEKYPEYTIIERIHEELMVIENSLTRFNQDVSELLLKEGWGEPWHIDPKERKEMTKLYSELKQTIEQDYKQSTPKKIKIE